MYFQETTVKVSIAIGMQHFPGIQQFSYVIVCIFVGYMPNITNECYFSSINNDILILELKDVTINYMFSYLEINPIKIMIYYFLISI